MSAWGTSAQQWASWITEPAEAEPATTLDAFDAELTQRLEAGGFLGNLEQTSVSSTHTTLPPDALDNDATIVRPSPLYDINDEDEEDETSDDARPVHVVAVDALDDEGEAAKTMVRGQIPAAIDVHDNDEVDEVDDVVAPGAQHGDQPAQANAPEQNPVSGPNAAPPAQEPPTQEPHIQGRTADPLADADGEETLRVRGELEVGLEAPEAGLEVGLAPSAQAEVEGLFIPTLTKPAEAQPPTAFEGLNQDENPGDAAADPTRPVPPVIVPTDLPPRMSSGGTVVAPAPTAPPPTAAEQQSAVPEPIAAAEPIVAPEPIDATVVTTHSPARTGDTLPPVVMHSELQNDVVTAQAQASSSGVFSAANVRDEEPAPPPLRQKVVIGAPMPAPEDVTSEIDAADLLVDTAEDEEVDDGDGGGEEHQQAQPVPPPPKESAAKPPPPKDKAVKGPPAPPPQAKAPRVEAPDAEPVATQTPSAAASSLARTPSWPEEVFAEHFTAMTRDDHPVLAKAEVEFFLQSTNLQQGARVLDVGCGDGAHALALSQQGFTVTGLDLSPSQIRRAQMANEALGGRTNFVQGDMRDLPVEGPFEAILCLGTTFGFYDDEVNRAVLRNFAKQLVPGGRLLLQVFNRDHIIGRLPARSWWQGRGCLVLDEVQMNYFTSRLAVHRTVVFEDGRQFEHNIKIRGYNANELGRLCVDAGLRVIEISGSRLTRGRFYGSSSPDIWLLVEPKT